LSGMQESRAARDVDCTHVLLIGQGGFRGPDHAAF
jgi:hypothetical protein